MKRNNLQKIDNWMRNEFFDVLLAFSFIGQLVFLIFSVEGNGVFNKDSMFWISAITLISLGKILLKYGKEKQ